MILEHNFSILLTSFFNEILFKVVLVSLEYTTKILDQFIEYQGFGSTLYQGSSRQTTAGF